MNLNISRSTAVSGFTISTGDTHYISPHTPLGMSATHSRYIRPVPPTYVTEYEANYKWYPPEFYGATPRGREIQPPQQVQNGHGEGPAPIQQRTARKWENLLSSVNRLIEKKYEENLLSLVKQQVQNKQLDAGLEFAYRHCQDVLRSTEATETADGADGAATTTNGVHNGHARACVSHLPSEIRDLCKSFVAAVDALKQI
jgi:hypothetical protein